MLVSTSALYSEHPNDSMLIWNKCIYLYINSIQQKGAEHKCADKTGDGVDDVGGDVMRWRRNG